MDHCSAVQPRGHLIMSLPFSPRAARAAREAATVAVSDLRGDELPEHVGLVCSELATNAFRHGSPPLVLAMGWETGPTGCAEVEITVVDGGCRSRPELRTRTDLPPAVAEDGRGLGIVQELASAWSLDIGSGRTRAWCRLMGVLVPDPSPEAALDARRSAGVRAAAGAPNAC
ncbi:ATP-binding protein [Streptomyces sp. SCUT-3]|uniref:ATP-binding protein n=1 Tax=Streptomyces sp. SCUT-3 TaxID=2684469 RepID=UPI000CC31F2C|nr:ATP-binding protein [Streptomyces sp. SCUT-3]PLW66453.1 diguanylate cyclase [Streptomyces sp. DJ]QMV22726.1 ATP-binding protein [Streptomyces sp. SCUT-3]